MKNLSPSELLGVRLLLALVISAGSVFVGYKVGVSRTTARDKSAFADYLAYVQQKDESDCKDVVEQEALACVRLVDAKCANSSSDVFDEDMLPSAPMPKLELKTPSLQFPTGEMGNEF